MKKIILMLLLISSGLIKAQNKTIATVHGEKIGYDARITTLQRNDLPKTVGLMIFNTDPDHMCHEFWDGTGWFNYCWGGYYDPGKKITITTQPIASTQVCAGSGTQTLTVVATGTGLTYQWRKNGTNVTNAGAISGAATATLTLINPTATDAGNYDVVVNGTNAAPVTSIVAAVAVTTLPTITGTTNGTGTGTATIGAMASAGAEVKWYAAATGGSVLYTGASYIVNTSGTYYAGAVTTIGGCVSASRTAVIATVNIPPAITGVNCGIPGIDTGTLEKDKAPTGVTRKISVTANGANTFNISTNTVNGVKFEGTAVFAGAGTQEVTLTAIGVPTMGGSNVTFTLNTTPVCTFTRTIIGDLGNGTVLSPTGKVWKDKNEGATQVATSGTDHNSYGSLFQWGRDNDGHERMSWSGPTTGQLFNPSGSVLSSPTNTSVNFAVAPWNWSSWVPNNYKGSVAWDGGYHKPCPDGYRVPTQSEWQAEITALGITNAQTAYQSILKLPLAGTMNSYDGLLYRPRDLGMYWTATESDESVWDGGSWVQNENAPRAIWIEVNSINANFIGQQSTGASLRCIKN